MMVPAPRLVLLVLATASALAAGSMAAAGPPPDDRPRAQPRAAAASVDWLAPASSTLVAESTHDWNNYAPDQSKVITYGDYQYALFYADDLRLTLSRRNLQTDDVQLVTFPEKLSRPDDTHNNSVLGISAADGRLHLAYDHHGQPLHYRSSVAGLLTTPPATITTAHFNAQGPLVDGGPLEQAVTYPRFVNDPHGNLMLIYRHGSSGNGTTYIHRYDAAASTWSRDGALFSPNGVYPDWENSADRNAYLHDVLFDDAGRMHVSWIWRETPAWPSNHGIHYAYSDDNGVTWFDNDGQQVADTVAGDPIALADDTVVVDIPVWSFLMNQGVMTLDAANEPHIITYVSTVVPATDATKDLHYVHFWRDGSGQWQQDYIDDTGVDLPKIATLTHGEPIRRGDAFVDEQNVLHFYAIVSGALYEATADGASGWSSWTVRRLTEGSAGLLDQGPKFDRVRWQRDGVISMMVSRVQVDGELDFYAEEFTLQPSAAPAAPVLSLQPARGQGIELVIDGAHGAEAFRIARRAAGEPGFTVLDADYSRDTMRRGYVDATAVPGTEYTYRVQAVNGTGHSGPVEVSGTIGGGWSDYTIDVDVRIETWSAGVVFRASDLPSVFDNGDFYWWAIQPDRDGGQLLRLIFSGGTIRRLDPIPLPAGVTVGSTHHLRISAIGDQITTWIDGAQIDQLTDGTHASGTVGVRHGSTDGDLARYDNLVITGAGGAVLHEERFSDPTRVPCGSLYLGALRVSPGSRCTLPEHTVQ